MNAEINLSKSQCFVQSLEKLKDALRAWYGGISVKELMSNRLLIKEIEDLRVIFSQMGVCL